MNYMTKTSVPRILTAGIVVTALLFIFPSGTSAQPLADGAKKFLGNITSRRIAPDDVNFSDYWNQVTPENEGKWGTVERTRNVMSWTGLDSSYAYARRHNLPFKLHTLVWGYQEPGWIGSLSSSDQLEEVTEWIKLCAERYPDVDFIDVVNEPLNTPASFREALGGMGDNGYEWVIKAFELAREYFPKAKLLINEFHVIDNDGLTEQMTYIANLLKSRNLIDGIGLQAHYFSYPLATPEQVEKNIDKLASTGLPIYITELDVTGSDDEQLSFYKTYFPLLWEHPNVHGITLWGWVEGTTWERNTYLITKSGNERPAFTWLKEYIADHKDVEPVTASRRTLPETGTSFHVAAHDNVLFITLPEDNSYTTLYISDLGGRALLHRKLPLSSQGNIPFVLPKGISHGIYFCSIANEAGLVSTQAFTFGR